jgi:hypothetical protein
LSRIQLPLIISPKPFSDCHESAEPRTINDDLELLKASNGIPPPPGVLWIPDQIESADFSIVKFTEGSEPNPIAVKKLGVSSGPEEARGRILSTTLNGHGVPIRRPAHKKLL